MVDTEFSYRLFLEPRLGRPDLSEMDLKSTCLSFKIYIGYVSCLPIKKLPLGNFLFLRNLTLLNANCCCIYLRIWSSASDSSVVAVILSWRYIFLCIGTCMIALRIIRQCLKAISFIHSTSDCPQISQNNLHIKMGGYSLLNYDFLITFALFHKDMWPPANSKLLTYQHFPDTGEKQKFLWTEDQLFWDLSDETEKSVKKNVQDSPLSVNLSCSWNAEWHPLSFLVS